MQTTFCVATTLNPWPVLPGEFFVRLHVAGGCIFFYQGTWDFCAWHIVYFETEIAVLFTKRVVYLRVESLQI